MFWFNIAGNGAASSDPFLEWIKALSPIIGSLVAMIGVILTIRWGFKKGAIDAKYHYASKMLDLRMNQLTEFYSPMKIQLEQSRALYRKLLWCLKKIKKSNPSAGISLKGFRLLDHGHTILNNAIYADAKPLVEAIRDIGKLICDLIAKNAGLIEGGMTATYTEYLAHFRMLEAALQTPPPNNPGDGWQEFGYFPRILNREVAEGLKEVLRHFQVYREAGDEIIGQLLGKMPQERQESFRILMDNLRYYEANAEAYATAFNSFDGSKLREQFIKAMEKNLTAPSIILDAGCGTGRDAEHFIKAGYSVTAFDASPSMVRLCARVIRQLEDDTDSKIKLLASKSKCDEMTFDEITYRNMFDGVWASASLLHIPKRDIAENLTFLVRSLKSNGVIFMSFKYGMSESHFDSRYFSSFSRKELKRIIKESFSLKVVKLWISNPDGETIGFCGAIVEGLRIWWGSKPRVWINVVAKRIS